MFKDAPHKDVGSLACNLIEGVENLGETVMSVLDMPLDATIGLEGPHRVIGNVVEAGAEGAKKVIKTVTGLPGGF